MGTNDLPVFACPALELQVRPTVPNILQDLENQNSGPHAYASNSLPT